MSLAGLIADAISNATADYQPDDLIDVLGLLVSNLPAIIAAVAGCSALVVAIRSQRKGAEDRQVLDDIHKQAVNDHPEEENMRDQLDRMESTQKRHDSLLASMNQRSMVQGSDIGGLREDIGAVRDEVGGLRGEMRDDRTNLREFKAGVNGFIGRVHPNEDPI